MTPEQILSEEVFTIHACPGADRLAECSRQTAFRDSAADLIADAEFHAETVAALREGVRRESCPICLGVGSCPPIPAKGKQGVWQWTT